ncbi:MAG: glycosyltransferase [Sphaerochaetaceae bacterium]|nr:glycosyltransferase [Sphaerochaetaceae bacterium]
MKIVFIDVKVSGHHYNYLLSLLNGREDDSVVILPQRIEGLHCKQHITKYNESEKRTLKKFKKWVLEVLSIVKSENPDIIHFLYGDSFYRFFGYGLNLFCKYKTIMTFHWIKTGFLGKLSLKMISSYIDKIVVHTDFLNNQVLSFGISNVSHIEYPQFKPLSVSKKESCDFWGMSYSIPTIACIGNTRYDKGIDLLLAALIDVKIPFQLLIAGKEEAFDDNYILKHSKPYADNVFLCLHYLSDEELKFALGVADIIALPYRSNFNGASGPLCEGVWLYKCIIGSNQGNLGHTISENHLGYTFITEDIKDLSDIIRIALSNPFIIDEQYRKYREMLSPDIFRDKYNKIYKLLA